MASTASAAPSGPGYLVLGAIGAPHGVRGAVKVRCYAASPEVLLDCRQWRLRDRSGAERVFAVREASWDGHALRATFAGVEGRDAAEALRGCEVLIAREALPAPAPREYYRQDLLGFCVRNCEGIVLGTVRGFVDAPGNPLMIVQGASNEPERWVPGTAQHLRRVDTAHREIEVDWPAEF